MYVASDWPWAGLIDEPVRPNATASLTDTCADCGARRSDLGHCPGCGDRLCDTCQDRHRAFFHAGN